MTTNDIIRAWKDADYRDSLSAEERALLPAHPVGDIDLQATELDDAHTARPSTLLITCTLWITCE
jgi:mersacidin/lichenicidin family type 2 lantibiotic